MDYRGASGYIWTAKTIKYALFFLAALVFLVLILVGTYKLHENEIQRREIEKVASRDLGVKVDIGSFESHPGRHSMSFSSIKIASPPGFNTDLAIQIGSISIKDISSVGDQVVFGKVFISHVVVYMGIRRDATNLMPLLSGIDTSELARGPGFKATFKNVISDIVILRPFPIPLDRNFSSVNAGSLSMKNVGGKDSTVGQSAIDVLRGIMRLCYRSAATQSYLVGMETASLQQIQSSVNVGKGFVSVAKAGGLWGGDDENNSNH